MNVTALIAALTDQNQTTVNSLKSLVVEIEDTKLQTNRAFDEFIRMQGQLRDAVIKDYDTLAKRVKEQIAILDGQMTETPKRLLTNK